MRNSIPQKFDTKEFLATAAPPAGFRVNGSKINPRDNLILQKYRTARIWYPQKYDTANLIPRKMDTKENIATISAAASFKVSSAKIDTRENFILQKCENTNILIPQKYDTAKLGTTKMWCQRIPGYRLCRSWL